MVMGKEGNESICPVLENNEEIYIKIGFSGGAGGKESPANAGVVSLIPGSGRSPGGGHGNTLQYFYLENSMTVEPGGLQSIVLHSWTQLK